MKIIHHVVAKNMLEYKEKAKMSYNKNAKLLEFKGGDQVLMLRPKKDNKLQSSYVGPYQVIKRI